MKESIPYIILLLFVIGIAFIPVHNYPERITSCRIDSIEVIPKNIMSQEVMNKCYTSCGEKFLTNRDYKVGDSIKIKTIIINEINNKK